VTDSDGTPVRSLRWTGTLDSFEWDGTDDSGNRLPDGDYRYQVSGTDLAGNTTALSIPGLRIDTAPTPGYLTAAEGFIKAGENGS
jgi:flagellar hook assembly protein FlgD